jgi:hypothetical protein
MQVRMLATEEGVKTMVNHLKAFIPIVRGSMGTVVCKPLEPEQSWTSMLGYVQKDHGQVIDLEIQIHSVVHAYATLLKSSLSVIHAGSLPIGGSECLS